MVRGKDFERRVAKDFGGRRTPGSGAYVIQDTLADVIHDFLFIECKHRQDRIRWIWNLLMRTMELAKEEEAKRGTEEKTGVVAFKLREPGQGGKKTPGYAVLVHVDGILSLARERALALAKARVPAEVLDDKDRLKAFEDAWRDAWDEDVEGLIADPMIVEDE